LENRAAKRHSLPMVGAVFLHQSGATPLPKWDTHAPFLPTHFTKQVAALFEGYSLSLWLF